MLKFVAFAGALALSAPALAQTQQEPVTAALYVERLQPMVGQDFGGGIVVKNVSAEQNIVVVLVDGPEDFRGNASPEELTDALLKGLCGSAANFFVNGIAVRLDTLEAGDELVKGSPATACPAQ